MKRIELPLRHLPMKRTEKQVREYFAQWDELGRVAEDVFGAEVYAFDPDIALRSRSGGTMCLPSWAAVALYNYIMGLQGKGADNDPNHRP